MKRILTAGIALLVIASCASMPEFARSDPENDMGIGRLVWSISNEAGEIVDQGEIYNGRFRMDESFKRDTHFLDFREDGSVRVALITWGSDTYRSGQLFFQVLYEDVYHPGQTGFKKYQYDDVEIFYDYRQDIGPMPIFVAVPEGRPLEMALENGFTFTLLPGSVYLWVTDRPQDYYTLGQTFVLLDEIYRYQQTGEELDEETKELLESAAAPELTFDNMQVLAQAYVDSGHIINDEIGLALFDYYFVE